MKSADERLPGYSPDSHSFKHEHVTLEPATTWKIPDSASSPVRLRPELTAHAGPTRARHAL